MKLYVGNLAFSMTEDDLLDAFTEFGEVSSVTIIMDRKTNRSKGFGFVEMSDDSEAQEAIDALDGTDIKGRNVKVNEARPREEKPRRKPRY